jgi:hypothetical protein
VHVRLHHASVAVDAAGEDDERRKPLAVAVRDEFSRRRQPRPEDDVCRGSCRWRVNVEVGGDPLGLCRAGQFPDIGGHSS